MSQAKHIFPFLVPTLVLALILAVALLVIPKAELHLALCQPHTPFLDAVVPVFSNLVDWLPYLIVVLLLFYRAGWATLLASNLLLTTLIVQPIKHIIHAPRPLTWFAENMPDIALPLVEGVRMNHWLSFPSGHTATAFAGAELVRAEYGWGYGIAAYTVATGVAFMRLYNNRHWLNDVLAGAGVGIVSAQIGYWMLPLSRKIFKMDRRKALVSTPMYYPEQNALGMACAMSF